MLPRNLPPVLARSLATATATGMASTEEAVTLDGTSHASSGTLAVLIVAPTVVGIVLIVALLLMSKNLFVNIAVKVGIWRNNNADKLQPWPDRKARTEETPATKPTFLQRHLEMLRAWQKPTIPAQPQLPLYLGRADATNQPRRPTGMTFNEWQERYCNRVDRPKTMQEFQFTVTGNQGHAYWKEYAEEIEARKSWWEKAHEKLRKLVSSV